MNRDPETRYYKDMPEPEFPFDIIRRTFSAPGPMIPVHWHEHMQFFYILEGESSLTCGSRRFTARKGDLVIVNPCEVHSAECVTAPASWDVIRADFALLSSREPDFCQTRYIQPLENGQIVFENLVRGNPEITEAFDRLVREHAQNESGHELAVKASLYRILFLLFHYSAVRRLDSRARERQNRSIERLSKVLKYIEKNICSTIEMEDLATIAGVTVFHFCRIFRTATGFTPVEYIQRERVFRAETLLRDTGMTVAEIAWATGFGDANYFSRVFKRCRGISPRQFRLNPPDVIY